eukprot:3484176-Amphidinium_carterae.1
MRIKRPKTRIYHPGGAGPSDPALRELWCFQPRRDGLTLVGQPLAYADSDAPRDMAVPAGTDEYIAAFLSDRLLDFEKRLSVA